MTLAAVRKLVFKLPLSDRLKLVEEVQRQVPPMRAPVTLEELERRADEVDAGTAKLVSSEEFGAWLKRMKKSVGHKRSTQRG
jgi:hypothetical protein